MPNPVTPYVGSYAASIYPTYSGSIDSEILSIRSQFTLAGAFGSSRMWASIGEAINSSFGAFLADVRGSVTHYQKFADFNIDEIYSIYGDYRSNYETKINTVFTGSGSALKAAPLARLVQAQQDELSYLVYYTTPWVYISSDKQNITAGQVAAITFTLSEPSDDFDVSDVSVSGGALSNFAGSGKVYTASFTPSSDFKGVGSVSVPDRRFSDDAGNENLDGNTNPLSVAVDTTAAGPTYGISAGAASYNEGTSASFTVTTTNVAPNTLLSYTITGVAAEDITTGSLSGTTTVGANGQATISIPLAADQTTEGDELLTVTIQGQTASTTVKDTSLGNDLDPPTVINLSPVDEATAVAVGSNIVVTFSENIQRGVGNIILRKADGTTIATYTQSSSEVAVSGNTLTINPASDLAYSTGYRVEFASGSAQDSAGNAFAGATDYNFMTATERGDTSPPVETGYMWWSLDPNGDHWLDLNTRASFTFVRSEPNLAEGASLSVKVGTAGHRAGDVIPVGLESAVANRVTAPASLTISEVDLDKGYARILISATADYITQGDRVFELKVGEESITINLIDSSQTNTPSVVFMPTVREGLADPSANQYTRGYIVEGEFLETRFFSPSGGDGYLNLLGFDPSDFSFKNGWRLGEQGAFLADRVTSTIGQLVVDGVSETERLGLLVTSGRFDNIQQKTVRTNNWFASTAEIALVDAVAPPDTTVPTLATPSPADGATDVVVDSNITLTFSEAIQRGTGTIELRSGSATGAIVESFNAATSNRLTVSANTLSVDPTSSLSNSTSYFLVVPAGAIKDLAGNNYAGTSAYDFATVAPPDTTAPTLATPSPADGATDVVVDSNITLTFSEAIQRGTGTIELRSGSATGAIVESFNAATSNRLTVSANTLTVDPTSSLSNSTSYFLVVPTGAIKDLAGNNYAGTSAYDFATVSWTQLIGGELTDSAKSLTIGLDGAIYVGGLYGFVQGQAGNRDFITRYNPDGTKAWTKLLDALGGVEHDFSLTTGADGAIYMAFHGGFGVYRSTIARYTPDGSQSWAMAIGTGSTFSNTSSVATGADGAIYVCGSTNGNLEGLTNNGGNGDAFISKYNPDGTRIWTKLLGSIWTEYATCLTTGADGAVYVAGVTSGNLDGNNLNGLNDAFITRYNSDGTKLWTNTLGTVSSFNLYRMADTRATCVAIGTDGAIYMAGYTSGKFLDGQASGGATDAFITRYKPDGTKDWTQLLGGNNIYSYDQATCLTAGPNGEIYMGGFTTNSLDGQMSNGDTDAFVTRYNSDGTKVWTKLLGTSSYDAASSLTIGPNGAMYVAGSTNGNLNGQLNNGNGDAFITKLLIDITNPTVSSFSPTDASVNVAVTDNVVLIFSEDVVRGPGNIEIRSGSPSGILEESFSAATSSRLTFWGNTLTIDPTNNLAGNTKYFVVFAAGSVQDLAGNNYAGTTSYNFTTGAALDTTAPTASTFSPADEATAVAIGANVVATFSEAIQLGAGSIVLKKADGATVATFVQSSTEVTVSGSTLTINPTSDLSYSTGYKVEFAAGSVQDLAGNNYAGTTSYNFTTVAAPDTTVPTLATPSPADGATDVVVDSNITLTFSEAIQRGTGTIELRSGSATGAIVESFNAATSNRLTVSANTLTVDPTSSLSNSTSYFLVVPAGAIKDLAGNNFAGASAYDFATSPPDNTAPTLTTVNLLSGSTEDSPFTISYAALIAAADEADAQSDPIFFRLETLSSGTLTKGGAAATPGSTVLGPGELLVWIPAVNANGTLEAFKIKAVDGALASALAVPVRVAVTAVNDLPTGAVAISGNAKQGETLTASNTLTDLDGIPGSGPNALVYQWLANGAPISGARGPTFMLTEAQVGKSISVRAAYTDNFGTLETVTSLPSVPVAGAKNVAPEAEQAVPALPTISGSAVAGDGNGDGVADSLQANVTSAPLTKQDGSSIFVTLVADSVAGKSASNVDVTIASFEQKPVPAALPNQMEMPLGLIAFTAAVQTAGKTERFSLYVDTALGVNGYWKQDAQNTWVNLASAPWGGSTTVEGGKTRLDFVITDGGLFDGDRVADGVIVDPGAAALMPLSLVGYTPPPVPAGLFWF